jgi:hypothetical protein
MPLVLGACIPCHSAEMVAQQRLDPATWEAIVDRMITYGAPITPETKPLILQYLATRARPVSWNLHRRLAEACARPGCPVMSENSSDEDPEGVESDDGHGKVRGVGQGAGDMGREGLRGGRRFARRATPEAETWPAPTWRGRRPPARVR